MRLEDGVHRVSPGDGSLRKRQLKEGPTGPGEGADWVRPGELGYEKKWSCLGAAKGLGTVLLWACSLILEGGALAGASICCFSLGCLQELTLPLVTSFIK